MIYKRRNLGFMLLCLLSQQFLKALQNKSDKQLEVLLFWSLLKAAFYLVYHVCVCFVCVFSWHILQLGNQ